MTQYRDRVRVVASAARTVTGQSAAFETGYARYVNADLDITAQSGTTPTITVSVEWSHDGGTTWVTADPADAFTQVGAATARKMKSFVVKAPLARFVWTIAGTTPSYTFSIDAFLTD